MAGLGIGVPGETVVGILAAVVAHDVLIMVKAGWDVTILHRKSGHDLGRRVHEIVGDRNDPASIKAALTGTRFEVVFDNVYDWQRGTTAAQVEATVKASGDRLVRYADPSSGRCGSAPVDPLAHPSNC